MEKRDQYEDWTADDAEVDELVERWLRGEDVSVLDLWAEWDAKYADEEDEGDDDSA